MRIIPIVIVGCAVVLLVGCASMTPRNPEGRQPAALGTEPIAAKATNEIGIQPAVTRPEDLEKVYFQFNSFELTAEATRILKRNADFLKSRPNLAVEVAGHCDERGSKVYNRTLARKRAESVRNYLMSLGVAAQNLSIAYYGDRMPADKEQNEDAWTWNRRVEFSILKR